MEKIKNSTGVFFSILRGSPGSVQHEGFFFLFNILSLIISRQGSLLVSAKTIWWFAFSIVIRKCIENCWMNWISNYCLIVCELERILHSDFELTHSRQFLFNLVNIYCFLLNKKNVKIFYYDFCCVIEVELNKVICTT